MERSMVCVQECLQAAARSIKLHCDSLQAFIADPLHPGLANILPGTIPKRNPASRTFFPYIEHPFPFADYDTAPNGTAQRKIVFDYILEALESGGMPRETVIAWKAFVLEKFPDLNYSLTDRTWKRSPDGSKRCRLKHIVEHDHYRIELQTIAKGMAEPTTVELHREPPCYLVTPCAPKWTKLSWNHGVLNVRLATFLPKDRTSMRTIVLSEPLGFRVRVCSPKVPQPI